MKTLLALFCLCSLAAFAANRPNIVIILSDDYGYGSAGCYGTDKTLIWLRIWQEEKCVRDHFLMTLSWFQVSFSHLRSRLTSQGDFHHFGGYADIRVLANAFF